jgi:Fe2+ or Zn2+ uptake regulation protein
MATDLRISSKHLQTEADRQLRASGVRVTASRLDVLSVLLRAKRALSHLEVHDAA